jgi:hypothetical protein
MTEAATGGRDGRMAGGVSSRTAARAVRLLSLAAAPTFAVMALLTGPLGPPDALCTATPHTSSVLNGMAAMYALMSAFHSAPWLKLVSNRCNHARRA